jgi:hypothetical protein
LEFKDEHVAAIKAKGRHSWQRARRAGSGEDQFEVLVGGNREDFVSLIRFERKAFRVASAERLRIASAWVAGSL